MKIAITATPSQARFAPILWRGDVAKAFRDAAELGCQGVELLLRRAEDVDLRCVKQLMADYQLEVPTLGTGMAAAEDGLTFSDPDATVRVRAVERACAHVRLASEIGSAVTIGILSGKLGNCEGEERCVRRARALECLADLCRTAERLGVTILLEPLNRYECDYINTLADGMKVAAEIGAPNLKLLADTFHMNIEEVDLAASLRATGARLGHVHLADTNRQAPGHGHLNVAGVLEALVEIGYQGYLSFEVLPLPDACHAVRDGIEAIHAALGVV
jgi:sugar phosphate isomerase/epimerase